MRRLAEQPKKKSASAGFYDEKVQKDGMGKMPPRGMCRYAPCAEGPMIPIHCVGEFARFGTTQCIAEVAIWVERISAQMK
jgi:hypothetical protein